MDEYEDHFRIATTVPRSWGSDWESSESNNNLYIVRADNLTQVGELEGLAPVSGF